MATANLYVTSRREVPFTCHIVTTGCVRILESHGKSWNLKFKISRPGKSWSHQWSWKVLENAHKKVMESHGKPLSVFCMHPVIKSVLCQSALYAVNCKYPKLVVLQL